MPNVADEWWTTSDIAEYLHISVKSVNNYVSRRRPVGHPIPQSDRQYGRTRVWRPVRIVEWHERRPGSGNWGSKKVTARNVT